jgi:hypothetical protein
VKQDSKDGRVSGRFAVEEVFQRPQRGLTVAVGQVLDAVVSAGMALQVEGTGAVITIAGIERIPPSATSPDQATLIIDPASKTPPARGIVLVVR